MNGEKASDSCCICHTLNKNNQPSTTRIPISQPTTGIPPVLQAGEGAMDGTSSKYKQRLTIGLAAGGAAFLILLISLTVCVVDRKSHKKGRRNKIPKDGVVPSPSNCSDPIGNYCDLEGDVVSSSSVSSPQTLQLIAQRIISEMSFEHEPERGEEEEEDKEGQEENDGSSSLSPRIVIKDNITIETSNNTNDNDVVNNDIEMEKSCNALPSSSSNDDDDVHYFFDAVDHHPHQEKKEEEEEVVVPDIILPINSDESDPLAIYDDEDDDDDDGEEERIFSC